MKTYTFLTYLYGENATTDKDVSRVYNPETDAELLEKMEPRCHSFDDNGLDLVHVYGTKEIALPDEMSPAEYLRNTVHFNYLFAAIGPELLDSLPLETIRAIGGFEHGPRRTAVIELLATKKFRSGFRQSLRDQLEKWFAARAAGETTYPSPFSNNQWYAITKFDRRRY